jgi:hypothetical protein
MKEIDLLSQKKENTYQRDYEPRIVGWLFYLLCSSFLCYISIQLLAIYTTNVRELL